MRDEQGTHGQERCQAENTVHADDEAIATVYRLREGKAGEPEHVADDHAASLPRTPPSRATAYVHHSV